MGFEIKPAYRSKSSLIEEFGEQVNATAITWLSIPCGKVPVVVIGSSYCSIRSIRTYETKIIAISDEEELKNQVGFGPDSNKRFYFVPIDILMSADSDFAKYANDKHPLAVCGGYW